MQKKKILKKFKKWCGFLIIIFLGRYIVSFQPFSYPEVKVPESHQTNSNKQSKTNSKAKAKAKAKAEPTDESKKQTKKGFEFIQNKMVTFVNLCNI